jgi:hypothetical protein
MKVYRGVDVWTQVFLTSVLVVCERSDSRSGPFTPQEIPQYPLDRRLSGPQSQFGRPHPHRDSNSDPFVV